MNSLVAIASQFAEPISGLTPLGNGLINDTYLVKTGSFSFVLQRINRRVFPEPEKIMANLIVLDQHVKHTGDESAGLHLPQILRTQAGCTYFVDPHGDVWRALSFIAETESLETVRGIEDAYQAGWALGRFHRMLNDLDPALMNDTLPGFHITPAYLERYRQFSARAIKSPETAESRYCDDFIVGHESFADDLESAKHQGLLKIRVIHGDPKLNNFLFDKHSQQIVSVIDLDTVKPGLLHYDIGDCLRSCCHDAETDEFNPEIAAAILDGYLSETASFFTEQDFRYLYPAIRLIPFELGLRFYTDYLEGNRYFKVTEPAQNLKRAAEQFRLCSSVIAQEQALQQMLDGLRRKARS